MLKRRKNSSSRMTSRFFLYIMEELKCQFHNLAVSPGLSPSVSSAAVTVDTSQGLAAAYPATDGAGLAAACEDRRLPRPSPHTLMASYRPVI